MQCCEWDHISQLYKRNTGTITSTPGLSIVHKLKYEHVYLNNFQVDLAAQVLSESVAQALALGEKEASETSLSLSLMEKCSSYTKGKHERKPFMNPYRKLFSHQVSERRIPSLFQAVGKIWKEFKKRMLLSQDTLEGEAASKRLNK